MKSKNMKKFRVRSKLKSVANANSIRISIHKSNKYLYVQAIDDKNGNTIASSSTLNSKDNFNNSLKHAVDMAADFSEKLKKCDSLENFYFDRGKYKYHGVIKQFVDKLREHGISI